MFTTDRYKRFYGLKMMLQNIGNFKLSFNEFIQRYFFGNYDKGTYNGLDVKELVEANTIPEVDELVEKYRGRKFEYSKETELVNEIEKHLIGLAVLLDIQEDLASKEFKKSFDDLDKAG